MRYIDMHCDTLSAAYRQGRRTAERLDGTMADVKRLREAGACAQFFAMFLPQDVEAGEQRSVERGIAMLKGMYEIYLNTLAECGDVLAGAYSGADLEENEKNGKLSAFLTMENGYLAQGDLANLKRFYDMGVRLITLTWNDPNCFGYPNSEEPAEMSLGLTDFGKDAVRYLNELGVLVDVSHLSDGGFYDVAELAEKPFVASHSNCRALCPAPRNLTDDMIRVLAEHGGVAGINFEPSFLNADREDRVSRVEQMCSHICHFIKHGGVECVGIGTDFDGISGEFEIEDCTGMPLLFDALHAKGLSWESIEKIAYQNVRHVIREVCTA